MSVDNLEVMKKMTWKYQWLRQKERLAKMTPEELAEYRKKRTKYQQEYRQRKKIKDQLEGENQQS